MINDEGIVDFSVFGRDNPQLAPQGQPQMRMQPRQMQRPMYERTGYHSQVEDVRSRMAAHQMREESLTVADMSPAEFKRLLIEAIVEAQYQIEDEESHADENEKTMNLDQVQESLMTDAATRDLHDGLGGIING